MHADGEATPDKLKLKWGLFKGRPIAVASRADFADAPINSIRSDLCSFVRR